MKTINNYLKSIFLTGMISTCIFAQDSNNLENKLTYNLNSNNLYKPLEYIEERYDVQTYNYLKKKFEIKIPLFKVNMNSSYIYLKEKNCYKNDLFCIESRYEFNKNNLLITLNFKYE